MVCAVSMLIIYRPMMGIVYGDAFAPAVLLVPILIIGEMARALYQPYDNIILHKRDKNVKYVGIVTSVIYIVLITTLIPMFGLVAAAISSATYYCCWLLGLWIITSRLDLAEKGGAES